MKLAGLIVIGVAILAIILQVVFAGPTYGGGNDSVIQSSIAIVAAFLIGVGATLLLVDMSIRRQREGKTHAQRRKENY